MMAAMEMESSSSSSSSCGNNSYYMLKKKPSLLYVDEFEQLLQQTDEAALQRIRAVSSSSSTSSSSNDSLEQRILFGQQKAMAAELDSPLELLKFGDEDNNDNDNKNDNEIPMLIHVPHVPEVCVPQSVVLAEEETQEPSIGTASLGTSADTSADTGSAAVNRSSKSSRSSKSTRSNISSKNARRKSSHSMLSPVVPGRSNSTNQVQADHHNHADKGNSRRRHSSAATSTTIGISGSSGSKDKKQTQQSQQCFSDGSPQPNVQLHPTTDTGSTGIIDSTPTARRSLFTKVKSAGCLSMGTATCSTTINSTTGRSSSYKSLFAKQDASCVKRRSTIGTERQPTERDNEDDNERGDHDHNEAAARNLTSPSPADRTRADRRRATKCRTGGSNRSRRRRRTDSGNISLAQSLVRSLSRTFSFRSLLFGRNNSNDNTTNDDDNHHQIIAKDKDNSEATQSSVPGMGDQEIIHAKPKSSSNRKIIVDVDDVSTNRQLELQRSSPGQVQSRVSQSRVSPNNPRRHTRIYYTPPTQLMDDSNIICPKATTMTASTITFPGSSKRGGRSPMVKQRRTSMKAMNTRETRQT